MVQRLKLQSMEELDNIICIFGISIWGLLLAKTLHSKGKKIYFSDNNPDFNGKSIIDGLVCKKPAEIGRDDYVVIAVQRDNVKEQIAEQLREFELDKVYCLDSEEMEDVKKSIDMKDLIECLWFSHMKYELDWNNLETLDEKMQWIKLYDRREEYVQFADKYRARDYIAEKFGEQYLIPLLYVTDDYNDVRAENMPDCHFAIKSNCWSGDVELVRSKEKVDWDELRERFKKIFETNYSRREGEWWYESIKPYIVVEKLLENADGCIPNDYKLHFINGELQFIYCAIDREGKNYRKIYDPNWIQLPFSWNGSATPPELDKDDIECPVNFENMVRMGKEIAKELPYVRVDYYEVDGRLYFGEITISHGAGFDHFIPHEYDEFYGSKLVLPNNIG